MDEIKDEMIVHDAKIIEANSKMVTQSVTDSSLPQYIIRKGIISLEELIQATFSLAMQMDSAHKRYHRKSREIMIKADIYLALIAVVATDLQVMLILAQRNQDYNFLSDLQRIVTSNLHKEETIMSLQQANSYITMFL